MRVFSFRSSESCKNSLHGYTFINLLSKKKKKLFLINLKKEFQFKLLYDVKGD